MYVTRIPFALIDQGTAPIIRLGRWCNQNAGRTGVENLLKRKDRRTLGAVSEFLSEHRLPYQFIGGSVVVNALEGTPRKYKDIDILGVGTERNAYSLVQNLKILQDLGDVEISPGIEMKLELIGESDGFTRFSLRNPKKSLIFGNKSPVDLAITGLNNLREHIYNPQEIYQEPKDQIRETPTFRSLFPWRFPPIGSRKFFDFFEFLQ